MTSRIARAAAAAGLIVLLSACNMTVRLTTRVDANGRGTFGIEMGLDREFREQLESNASSLQVLSDLFDRLRASGWTVTRTEPSGGLDYQASRAFKDQKGFEQALSELGNAGSGTTSPLGGLTTSLKVSSSFLKTQTHINGTVDTSTLPTILQAVLNLKSEAAAKALVNSLADHFQFEVKATLPGSVSIDGGNGSVSNGVAVWSPTLGTKLDFSASSSAIKTRSLLMIGIPALLLLAGLGWFLLGRRQRPFIAEAPTPADRRRVTIPSSGPAPELLAIKPDAPEDVPIVIELDPVETAPPADATQ